MGSAADALLSRGLRVTAPRCHVLTMLADHPHSSFADLAAGLEPRLALSRQGLYNVLDDLTAARLLRRIQPAGMTPRYELRDRDDHHHLVCRSCGRIEDVESVAAPAHCLAPSQPQGFDIEHTEVLWWGRCADCATDDTSRATEPMPATSVPAGDAHTPTIRATTRRRLT